jgi:hypothetical protein
MHNLLSGRSVIESFAFCGSVSGTDGVQVVRADQIGGDQRWPVMQANNEAFAPQVLACLKGWGWSDDDSRHAMLNVNGSGISLGHPIGATGGRILANLTRKMQRRDIRYGLETMCIGGGQGIAAVFERA